MSMIDTPEGVELTIHIFATSDAKGLNTEIKLGGVRSLADFVDDRDPKHYLANFLPNMADDWRLMTADEIVEHKRENSPDKNEEEEE